MTTAVQVHFKNGSFLILRLTPTQLQEVRNLLHQSCGVYQHSREVEGSVINVELRIDQISHLEWVS